MKVLLAFLVLNFSVQVWAQDAGGDISGNLGKNLDQGKGIPQSSQKVDGKSQNDLRAADARAKNRMERQQNRVKREEKTTKTATPTPTKTENKETLRTTKEKKSEDDGKDLKEIKEIKENEADKVIEELKSQEINQNNEIKEDLNQTPEQVDSNKEKVESLELQNNDLNDIKPPEVKSSELEEEANQDLRESLEKIEYGGRVEGSVVDVENKVEEKVEKDNDNNDLVEENEESLRNEKNVEVHNEDIKNVVEENLIQTKENSIVEEADLDSKSNDLNQVEGSDNIETNPENVGIPDSQLYESFSSDSGEVLNQVVDNPNEPEVEAEQDNLNIIDQPNRNLPEEVPPEPFIQNFHEHIDQIELDPNLEQGAGLNIGLNQFIEPEIEPEPSSVIDEEVAIEEVAPDIKIEDSNIAEVSESNENKEKVNIGNIEEVPEKTQPEESFNIIENEFHENIQEENDRTTEIQEVDHESLNNDQISSDDKNLIENDIFHDDHTHIHNFDDNHSHADHSHSHTHSHPHSHADHSHSHADHSHSHQDHFPEDIHLNDDPIPELHIPSTNTITPPPAQSTFDPNPDPSPSPIQPTSPKAVPGPQETPSSPRHSNSNSVPASAYTELHQALYSHFSSFQSKYLQDPITRFSFYLLSTLTLLYLLWPSSNKCKLQIKIQKDSNFFKDLLTTVEQESNKTKKVIQEKLSELNRLDQDDQVFSGIFRSLKKIQDLETDFQVQVIDSHAEIWDEIEKRNSPLSPPREIKIPIPLD